MPYFCKDCKEEVDLEVKLTGWYREDNKTLVEFEDEWGEDEYRCSECGAEGGLEDFRIDKTSCPCCRQAGIVGTPMIHGAEYKCSGCSARYLVFYNE